MDIPQKYQPPLAPDGVGSGSGNGAEVWPSDIPEYCRGVEVHADEPYMSLGDGLSKVLQICSDIDDLNDLKDNQKVDALLFWLDRSVIFYTKQPALVQSLSRMRPLLERLNENVKQKQIQGLKEVVESIRKYRELLDGVFQLETGKLITSSALPLFPLMSLGLNPKILQIIQLRQPRVKVAGLLKLIADSKSGAINKEGFKDAVEALFADELK